MNHMDKNAYQVCQPALPDQNMDGIPFIDLQGGYLQRDIHLFPRQGTLAPWRLDQNYLLDYFNLRISKVTNPSMQFT